jgi:hypothetical protein
VIWTCIRCDAGGELLVGKLDASDIGGARLAGIGEQLAAAHRAADIDCACVVGSMRVRVVDVVQPPAPTPASDVRPTLWRFSSPAPPHRGEDD